MQSTQTLRARIDEIFREHHEAGRREFSAKGFQVNWGSVHEARENLTHIRQMQKELRLVKKESSLAMREIRASYSSANAHVGTGFGAGLMAGLVGKRRAGKINTLERDRLRQTEHSHLAPYEALSRQVEDILVHLDGVKSKIDGAISST